MKKPKLNLWRHKGLIFKLAYRRWYCLPEEQRRWTDPEDLFGEAMIRLVARADEYDAKQTQESTWVGMVADSAMADHVKKRRSKKRTAAIQVDLEDVVIPVQGKHFGDSHAQDRVEAFCRLASAESIQFVRTVLTVGHRGGMKVPKDLLWAAKRAQVTVEDFMRCQAALAY